MSAPEFKAASQLLEFCAASPAHAARGRKVARASAAGRCHGGARRRPAQIRRRSSRCARPWRRARARGRDRAAARRRAARPPAAHAARPLGRADPADGGAGRVVELVLALLDAGDRGARPTLSGEQRRLATLPLFLLAYTRTSAASRRAPRRVLLNNTLPMRCARRLPRRAAAARRVLADADDADGGGGGADGASGPPRTASCA